MALKRGLGKGLDSLIPTNVMMESEVKHATVSTASSPEEEKDGTLMVKLSKVEPNREQPRKNFDEDSLQELAESLKQFGMLQPISLYRTVVIIMRSSQENADGELPKLPD